MTSFSGEREESALNQYWYDDFTIALLRSEIEMHATSCAFLSTPSLFFSLPADSALRKNSSLFEFDRRWQEDPQFVFYDFNDPEKVPVSCWEKYDYAVIDPPFITEEVWRKYVRTLTLVLKKGGKVLFTSVIENHGMLQELLAKEVENSPDKEQHKFTLRVPLFRPGIPHLTYQYHCFVNYETANLDRPNPNLPAEDPQVVAARRMCNALSESQVEFVEQWKARDRANELPLPPPRHDVSLDPAMKWTRVPEGLTEYAGGADAPPPEKEIPLPPEYDAVARRRELMDRFKNGIDAVMRDTDVVMKETRRQSAGAAPVGSAASKRRVEALADMASCLGTLETLYDADRIGICAIMRSCLAELEAIPSTAGKFRELSADITRQYKSKIFNRQKELLAEMKEIKRKASTITNTIEVCKRNAEDEAATSTTATASA